MSENRVVVTGLGAVTPIGIGVQEFWNGLQTGRNGISKVSHFDVTDYRAKLAAEITDFNAKDWMDSKDARRMDRFTQFSIAAATMAMEDAGLSSCTFNKERAGVIIGSGIGGSNTLDEGFSKLLSRGPKSISPFFVSKLLINMAASMVSIQYGLKGPISALSVACSTGSNAIGDAMRIIQRGDADIMVAGSSEACITPLPYAGFCATRSMTPSEDPSSACRPFDKNRNGFVMGEGAGLVVLENSNHAKKRKAEIYAELAGYGNTADAFHYTAPAPDGDGMKRVMQLAIQDAKLETTDIDYINAHGTSTLLNDKSESIAINAVFGPHAKKLKVSSIKSMIGHLLAGSGSVEFVATVLSLFHKRIPPTINYQDPDPDCNLDYVPGIAKAHNVDTAMSNSFGFGGGNASLVIKTLGESTEDPSA
jgi:3-oxoacyl-[acyl-carrier-protein] synthase II